MNIVVRNSITELEELIKELCDYKRPICYNLSEILVIPMMRGGYTIFYQKDRSK